MSMSLSSDILVYLCQFWLYIVSCSSLIAQMTLLVPNFDFEKTSRTIEALLELYVLFCSLSKIKSGLFGLSHVRGISQILLIRSWLNKCSLVPLFCWPFYQTSSTTPDAMLICRTFSINPAKWIHQNVMAITDRTFFFHLPNLFSCTFTRQQVSTNCKHLSSGSGNKAINLSCILFNLTAVQHTLQSTGFGGKFEKSLPFIFR